MLFKFSKSIFAVCIQNNIDNAKVRKDIDNGYYNAYLDANFVAYFDANLDAYFDVNFDAYIDAYFDVNANGDYWQR